MNIGETDLAAQGKQSLNRITGVRLSYKVTAAIMVLVFVSVALVGTLSYYKYKSILNSLIQSRAEVTLSSLQSTAQAPLQLGLSLADVRTIRGVLEKTKARDQLIADISVFEIGATDDVLYSTDDDRRGAVTPDAWVAAAKAEKGVWTIEGENGRTLGVTLVDQLDQPVGGVTLTYTDAYADTRLAAINGELFDYALITIGGVVAIAFVLVQIVFRAVTRHLNDLTARASGAGAGEAAAHGDDEIDRSFRSFEDGAARAGRALDDLEAAVASAEDGGGGATADGRPGTAQTHREMTP